VKGLVRIGPTISLKRLYVVDIESGIQYKVAPIEIILTRFKTFTRVNTIMTKDNEERSISTKFSGEKGSDWMNYEVKTTAYAEKHKWKSAIDNRVINPTTKQQKAAEAAGKF
jgi:hypothetical protein